MRILLVDDDEALMESLAERLIHQRYAVDIAVNGACAKTYVDLFNYDLIVLDLMLPDGDGIEFCHQFRQGGYANPLMILTAKENTAEKVKALDAGADDYVVKPFNFDELCARIRALLRREHQGLPPILQWGALRLNPNNCATTYGQRSVHLTPKEFAMLELFLRHPQRIYSLGSIIDDLWSFEDPPGEDAIRTHIKGLRRKLAEAGAPKDLIKTVYGLGYRLREQPPPSDGEATAFKATASEATIDAAATAREAITSEIAAQRADVSAPAPAPWSKSWHAPTAAEASSRVLPTWPAYSLRGQRAPSGEQPLPGKIALACKHYLRTASQQVAILEKAAVALSEGTLDAKLHHLSQMNAHKLAGSLGSFGIPKGSQLARQIETQLRARALFAGGSAPASDSVNANSPKGHLTNSSADHLSDHLTVSSTDHSTGHFPNPPLTENLLAQQQTDDFAQPEVADEDKAIAPLSSAELSRLVHQLRQQLDGMSVQSATLAVSASVQESTPRLLIISEDRTLAQQLVHSASLAHLQAQFVSTPQQAEAYFSGASLFSAQTPDLLLLDLANMQPFLALIKSVKQDYALPIIVLENQLTLSDRLSLVQAGVEMMSDRTTSPAQIIEAAIGVLKASTSQIQVAIADDDPQMLTLLKVGLEPWGFAIHTFESALALWQWLTDTRLFASATHETTATVPKADILVLDIEMPEMNGIELCRVLRADARFRSLPILFLTVHQEDDLRMQAFQSGADDFIDKAVAPLELATRLRNQLARACRI
jgi:DNA-binding response OmpR family regulator/HPt (histidine-containing phosphotransfer) domain-containing protein